MIRCSLALALALAVALSAPHTATAEPIEALEAGDPGWAHCKNKGILDHCFKLKLKGGNMAKIAESDFAVPKKSQLSLVPREKPFKIKVDTYDFTIEVPENYLWATIPLKTKDGTELLLSVYADRPLARKAIAIWTRVQDEQKKLHKKEQDKKKPKAVAQLNDPFYAEFLELGGKGGKEIVVYGGSGYDTGTNDWAFVLDPDAEKVLKTHNRSYPSLQPVTVKSAKDEAAKTFLADGITGCDKPGSMRVWRLDGENELDVALDIDMMAKDMLGVPEKWAMRATKKRYIELWVQLQVDNGALKGVDLFDEADKCKSASGGYRIFWRNGTPRGKKL